MTRERRERILETLFQIRPGEFRLTALLFLQSLTVVGAFIVSRSVRDALFLAHGTKAQLPLMYIASAVAVAAVGLVYTRIADHVRRDHLTTATAALFAACFLGLRFAVGRSGELVYSGLYVFAEVAGALTVIQFWTLANDLFHARDAKRLFGTIGAGGTLANIVFGGAVGVLASRVGAENLLLLVVLLLSIVAGLTWALGHRVPVRLSRARSAHAARPGASRVLSSPHLKYVAALVAVTFLATTLIDFQFKTTAALSFKKDALAAFFGNFYAVTGFLALGVQFFGTSRVLSRFGVIAALGILPLFLGFGSAAMVVVPTLLAATFTKGSEYVFRYTINDATTQLLYLPVPANARGGAKAFIDGVVKPGAIAVSGVLLMGYKAWVGTSLAPLAIVSTLVCIAWGAVVLRMRGEYVRSLQDTLRRRRLDIESTSQRIADSSTAQVLVRALSSTDPQEVLNALELLPHAQVKVDAQVSALLSNPSPEVRIAALGHLGRAGSLQFGNAVFRLFDDPEPRVRAAAIDSFCAIGRDKALRSVRTFLKDASPQIRGAAIVSMIRYSGLDGVLAAAEGLKALISDPNPVMREQAARVLGAIGVRNFYHPVLELMNDEVLAVRRAAIAAAGQLKAPELATALIYRLSRDETAADAVEALSSFGTGIEGTLARVLDNPLEDAAIRRQVPRVLGRLGTPEAVQILTAHLGDSDEAVRRNLFAALSRALKRNRRLACDRKALLRAIDAELARAYHALACVAALDLPYRGDRLMTALPMHSPEALLGSALAEKIAQCEGRIFTLLGVLFPDGEVELIHAGFAEANAQDAARRRANALELLEHVLDAPMRRRLFPLLEDGPLDTRLREAAQFFRAPEGDGDARLRELMADESAWVRSCAVHLVGERAADPVLQNPIIDNLEHSSAVVRETAIAALEKQLSLPHLVRLVEKRVGDESEVVSRRAKSIVASLETVLAASSR